MTRALLTLNTDAVRDQAAQWIAKAPRGTRVEFRAPQRSIPQNNLMWSRLTDISRQVDWHGQRLTPTDWKDMFTASLRRARIVPNIDGDGFVQLGLHTSEMSKEEMANLLDLIDAFGAERGIDFQDSPDHPAPQDGQTDRPAAENDPPPAAAGHQSEESAPLPGCADEGDGGGVQASSPPSLPQGTMIVYVAALRRAQKKEALRPLAKRFWDKRGGWSKWQGTEDGRTAATIFNIFEKHHGDREALDRELFEVI